MEQELFSTAQIAAELEHKSKNPRRDVLNIAKRLGFAPVGTRPREGKNHGGKPEMLWSREQKDAILSYNRKRYNDGNIQDARADVTDTANDDATVTPGTAQANDDEIIATPNEQAITDISTIEPAPVVITLDERANRIRQLQADVSRGIIEIGNELLAAKKEVGHGGWGEWLKKEFEWSDRTARYFMACAERFGKRNTYSDLPPSTLKAMLPLPEGEEERFIEEQAAAGRPIETQSARDVQKNVKAFKEARATPKENAEEPTPDLSNVGEKFSIFGRETDEVTDDDRPVVSKPVSQDSAKQEETAADDFEPQNFAELIIDEEFSSILPPLKEYEFNLLEENILRDGILDPLKVWNGILLDGHARYEIAKRHNLPFKIVEVKSVTDRDDAIIWIIKNQLARRSLNQYERAQIVLKLQNEPQKK